MCPSLFAADLSHLLVSQTMLMRLPLLLLFCPPLLSPLVLSSCAFDRLNVPFLSLLIK
jgi:hypothetical protein